MRNLLIMVLVGLCLGWQSTCLGRIFPGKGQPWPKSKPEAQGMSSVILEQARAGMTDDAGTHFKSVHGIVIRNGYDVWHFGDPYTFKKGMRIQRDWASCGRSLMTAMFGTLFREHELGPEILEQPVCDSFNSYIAWGIPKNVKIKHLLSYTSCAEPPGSSWKYACRYFDMYRIIRDMDGTLPDYRLQRLADAIGADWQPYNTWLHKQDVPFLTIVASPAEAARWGYLWLNKGRWNGKQVVDEWLVNASIKPLPSPNGGFAHPNEGFQIHLNAHGMWGEKCPRDAYAAFGAGGCVIFVCPSLDLIVSVKVSPKPYSKRLVGEYTERSIEGLINPILEAVQ